MTVRYALLLLLLPICVLSTAQTDAVSGRVVDAESHAPLSRATLQLLRISTAHGRSDTTFVRGVLSGEGGRFTLSGVATGNYLLKVSFLGLQSE